jgi:hypothetical protein
MKRKFIGVHATDAINLESIRQDGLRAGDSRDLWLGRGVYFGVCSSFDEYHHVVDYGKSFLTTKVAFSGEAAVILCNIQIEGLFFLQNKNFSDSRKEFVEKFEEKVREDGIILPQNDDKNSSRPRSYVRFEVWRYLIERILGRRISSSICRFVKDPNSDAPRELPYEACVHDPATMEIIFSGTPEEARNKLYNLQDEILSIESICRKTDWEIIGATGRATKDLSQMVSIDFVNRLEGIAKNPIKNSVDNNKKDYVEITKKIDAKKTENYFEIITEKNRMNTISSLANEVRARNLKKDLLESDLEKILDDFRRRHRSATDQLMLPIGDSLAARDSLKEISDLPKGPEEAARELVRKFWDSSDRHGDGTLRKILKELPIEVRSLDIKGTAYFFPRESLAEQAVIIWRRGSSDVRRSDRAHELAHFIYQECFVKCDDEEDWCDRFADAFVREISERKAVNSRQPG